MTAPTESPADRIAEIRARAEAATPGPWSDTGGAGTSHWINGADGYDLAQVYGEVGTSNGKFLTHARSDIPWLLDEVEVGREALQVFMKEAAKQLTETQAEVERLRSQIDATRQMLRIECAAYDDNDWPDDLHLADVVEKHLARSARAEIEMWKRAALDPSE